MRIFCNICANRLCRQTKGYVTSCCHVLCSKCLRRRDGSTAAAASSTTTTTTGAGAGGSSTGDGGGAGKATSNVCTKCRRRCSMIGVTSDMPPAVQRMFVDPRQALLQLAKAYRFQTLQLWGFHQMMADQRRRQAQLRRTRAARAVLARRVGNLRQLRPRITLLRTELRNKFTGFVQAIKRGETVEEVRTIYESAQRTFARSHKLIEMTLPKLEAEE